MARHNGRRGPYTRKTWRVVNKDLDEDQIARGVIYSSELQVQGHPEIERIRHEVLRSDPNRGQHIKNLMDTSFFERLAEEWGWQVVNEVRY